MVTMSELLLPFFFDWSYYCDISCNYGITELAVETGEGSFDVSI